MSKALELRERLYRFYGNHEWYVKVVCKFLVALAMFLLLNHLLGYMAILRSPIAVLALSLACAFLPGDATRLVGILFLLAHLFALSIEVFAIGVLLFALMFFMYVKYSPKNSYDALLTAMLCGIRIPQIMPVALGLLRKPSSFLSMTCGIIVYYFLLGVKSQELLLASLSSDMSELDKVAMVMQNLLQDREMYVLMISFLLSLLTVFFLRRQDSDQAWSRAIWIGNSVNLVGFLIGYFLIGRINMIPLALLGTAISIAISLGLEFFQHNLDYLAAERVQFKDDEYYYYVKAVPKRYIQLAEKKVKKVRSSKTIVEVEKDEGKE